MAMINKDVVEKMKNAVCKIKAVQIGGTVGFVGPWLPDNYYDSFIECHTENQKELSRQEAKKAACNETWQTPQQEEAFNKRRKVQADRRKKAELAAEMATQNK